jgi:hypothetical protein
MYHEMSEAEWKYSLWHCRPVWIPHPLAMLAACIAFGGLGNDKAVKER